VNDATPKPSFSLWLKVFLLALLALLLVVFTAFAIIRNSPARLEVIIEKVASTVLQRELSIGELVEAELGWDTYLLARDVRLANPNWAEEADFVRAGRLLIRINLPSIWGDGPIMFDEIEASDVYVSVLAPEEHAPNWDFWPDKIKELELEQPDNKGKAIFPLLFSKGHINGGEVLYRDSDQHVVTVIEQLSIRETDPNAPVKFSLEGAVNEYPLEASGHIGPTAALLSRQALNLDLTVRLAELTVKGRGVIADLSDLSGVDLHLEFSSPRSRPILDILGMPEVRDGSLNFEGHVTDANPGLVIAMKGRLNEFDLRLSGTVADPVELNGVDMGFALAGPSIAELGAMFDLAGLPEIPYEVSGEVQRNGTVLALSKGRFIAGQGRMAIEGRLPDFPGIDDWELEVDGGSFNLSLLGPVVGVNDLPALPYDIKGKLESSDEGVELLDLRIAHPNSSLQLNGVVGEAPDYFDSRVDLSLSGNSLASSGLWLGVRDLPDLDFLLTATVSLGETGWQLSEGIFRTPGLELRATGEVDRLPDPANVTAGIILASPDLSATLKTYGFEQEGLPAFPVAISGELTGPPDALSIREAIAESGDSKLTVSGVLGDLSTQADMELAVSFASPDVLSLLPTVAEGPLPPLPVDAGGRVSISAVAVEVTSFDGLVGGAQMSLSGTSRLADPLEDTTLLVNAEGPDLGEVLGPWVQIENMATAPFSLVLDARFRAGGVEVPRLQAKVADTQLSGTISIDLLEDLSGARGAIQVAGPSSLNLAKTMGSDLAVPDAPYKLNINFKKVGDRLRLQPLDLIWGASDIGGIIDIGLGDSPVFHADLHSDSVGLLVLAPDLEALEQEELEKTLSGEMFDEAVLTEKLTTSELAERVIPGKPLDFGWLREMDASLKYKVDEVDLGNELSSQVAVDVAVKNGVFQSRELKWDGALTSGVAELTLRALEVGAAADIYLDFERIPLLVMLGGQPDNKSGSFYRARIKARGSSFQEFAKTANGALVLSAGGGRLNNKGIDLILGDVFEEIFTRINPFAETDPYTQVVCGAAAASIKDGKVSAVPGLVIRTDKMDIASGGEVNLQNERLNLAFNTRSRKGLGISASKMVTPYFKIGGTMANPRLTLDARGAAISGSAAVATAGLSILAEGLWDRWVATASNPCEQLITELSKKDKKAFKGLLLPQG